MDIYDDDNSFSLEHQVLDPSVFYSISTIKKASKKVWVKINKKILENLKDKMNVDRLEFFLTNNFGRKINEKVDAAGF